MNDELHKQIAHEAAKQKKELIDALDRGFETEAEEKAAADKLSLIEQHEEGVRWDIEEEVEAFASVLGIYG